jgi:subtilase family serine protease
MIVPTKKREEIPRGFGFRVLPFLLAFACSANAEPDRVLLHNPVPAGVARLAPKGRLPATNHLHLAIGLPLRNQAALDELLRQLYDPHAAQFHKFLTPTEFAARFGPTEQEYQAVISFAEANGLTVNGTHGNRVVLDVEGAASNVEQAFHVALRTYRHPTEARDFFASDTGPSVPTNLSVVTVEGLSDFGLPKPLLHKMDPLQARPLGGSGPNGYYVGNDFRNAYAPGASLNGAGQSVGLLEFSDYYPSDITNYENIIGLTNYVPLNNVVIDHPSPGTANNDEVALDIETAIAMAPGLSQVIVYEIKSVNPYSILSRMADDNLAKQLSSSWTWSGGPDPTIDSIFQQMASQGQSFFQASGDSDAYTGGQTLDNSGQTTAPVDSTNLTCVGGTTLTMNGSGVSWSSETVWNWNNIGRPNVGTGGGISVYYTIPYWQTSVSMTANSGSTTFRNIPDVALTADSVYVAYNNGGFGGFGGTSCAAPLWAGFCALVNQQSVATSGTTVGFLNPALYAIAAGDGYTNCFHDITTGNNIGSNTPGLFDAATNYDLCTGLGTPNGTNLINALAPPALPYFESQPSSRTVTNGTSVTFSATAAGQAPLSYQWLFNGTNLPAGGNISGTTSNVLSVTAATADNSGSYSLVATNNYGSATSSVAVLSVGFAPAFSAQPTNLTILSGGAAVFSAAVSGSAPLVYQWHKNGTNLVNGTGVSGAASNVLTLTAVTTNSGGNYNLSVTNGFGAAISVVATLTVNLLSSTAALASSENPSGFKDNVAFTAAVTPANATGSIQFLTNSAAFDLEPLVAGQAVSTNISSLPRGTNVITAIYSGDTNDLPVTNTLAQVVTNHPPVAAPAFYTNVIGSPLIIAIAGLATNWTDADGDTVSLVAVGVSTNGITLTNTGVALVYFNSNNVADQFVCTIADGFGGTNFQTVTLAPAPLPNTTPLIAIAVASNPDGSFTLNLTGVPGYASVLETTTNLSSPVAWLPLATNGPGTNAVWQFTDTQATNFPQRFYRLKLLP